MPKPVYPPQNVKETTMKITGFNVYLDICALCNASCLFCIAPTKGREETNQFYLGLNYGLNLARERGGTIQITGGEPTLSSRLLPTLIEVAKQQYHRVVVNTNGSGISRDNLLSMQRAGVTHLNWSRHHYDNSQNWSIMRGRGLPSSRKLKEQITLAKSLGISTRINCNLMKGQIDSVGEILKFLSWSLNLGCYNVSFSQTFPLGLFEWQVSPLEGFTEKIQIDLTKIVLDIDRICEPFDYVATSSNWGSSSGWGSSSKVGGKRRFWQRGQMIFSVKALGGYTTDGKPIQRSSNVQENDFAVVHPNGVVSKSWDQQEKVLFAPAKSTNLVGSNA